MQALSSSKRLLNPRQDFLPPGAVFALQAVGYAFRDISEAFSAEWELSSLESTYVICWMCICGSAGTLTLSLGSLSDAVSSSNLETLLSFSRRSREGVGSGRGYRMVSFQRVLVFKGYSFHIQFISVLAPASLQYYAPQPESQKADGTGGNCGFLGVRRLLLSEYECGRALYMERCYANAEHYYIIIWGVNIELQSNDPRLPGKMPVTKSTMQDSPGNFTEVKRI